MKKIQKTILWFLIVLASIVVLIIGYFFVQNSLAARKIRKEFQIPASHEGIQTYLFHEEFKPGMTRDEIHKVLDRIGYWEVRWYDDPNSFEGIWDSDTKQYIFTVVSPK